MKNFIILLSVLIASAFIQAEAQTKDNSVILTAMNDELQRSMKELKLKDYSPPFFIGYGIQDNQSYFATATLGSLIQTNVVPVRQKSSVRILVGDYEINDETIDDNLFSQSKPNEIALPLDDDYLGIRRALWVTTDAVYRNAAVQSQKNQVAIKQKQKPLDEIPHRTFAKTPPVVMLSDEKFSPFNSEKWDDYIRKASAVFLQYPEIESSGVLVRCHQGYNYFVNSEGTKVKVGEQVSALMVSAQLRNSKGEFFFDAITHVTRSTDEWPSLENFEKEIKAFADRLISSQKIQAYKDDYSGPVLFLGKSVGFIFQEALFSANDGLIASNSLEREEDAEAGRDNGINSKIGKLIVSDKVSVIANPKMKSFGGVDLLGSFEVDSEGVVPPDEIVLIDKGVLKNLLSARSITSKDQIANGHADGPGVITVAAQSGAPVAELKKDLIAEAKKQGLEYAYLVNEENGFGFGALVVTRIKVADGSEQPLRGASIRQFSQRALKKILAVSKEKKAYNLQGVGGKTASYIVPQAVLINDVEIRESKGPVIKKEDDYVPSPLKSVK